MARSWGVRAFLLVVLFLAGSALVAQTTSLVIEPTHIGSTSVNNFRYDIDHGATAQAITVTVDVSTTSLGGLTARLLDLDEWVSYGTVTSAYSETNIAGGVVVNYTTPARSGVRAIILTVGSFLYGFSGDCSGTISISSGDLSYRASGWEETDPYIDWFGRGGYLPGYGFFRSYRNNTAVIEEFSIYADFGTNPNPATARFLIDATEGVASVRILNADGETPVELASYQGDALGAILVDQPLTFPAYTGVVHLVLEIETTGYASMESEIYFPSSVFAHWTLVPPWWPIIWIEEPESESDSCAAAGSTGRAAVAVLLPSILLLIRRKKKLGASR